MAPKFTDAQRQAVADAMNRDGLTAAEATRRARQGELASVPAFVMAESTARDVAAQARRESPEAAAAEREQVQDQLFESGVKVLTGQLHRLIEAAEEDDLTAQQLTRMGKILKNFNILIDGHNAQRLRRSKADTEHFSDDVAPHNGSKSVEQMLAALDQPRGGV